MALITCADCGQPVSELAASCPHCGRPRSSQAPINGSEVLAAVCAVVGGSLALLGGSLTSVVLGMLMLVGGMIGLLATKGRQPGA